MTDNNKKTIRLTGRPPVTFNPTHWPVVARGLWHDSRNGIERDASRTAEIRVRLHVDGRAIIYGRTDSRWQGEESRSGGELGHLDSDLPGAIRRVAESVGIHPDAAQACIDELPAEDLDA